MQRERIKLDVHVDLDPVPGTFHTKGSARDAIARILQDHIPHYSPTVSITNYQETYDKSPSQE